MSARPVSSVSRTLHQLFDVAQVVVHQPLPKGNRVAIVTNSDALGTLTAQACQGWGLDVTHGPVALPSEASGEAFRVALDAAFVDLLVDSVPPASCPHW